MKPVIYLVQPGLGKTVLATERSDVLDFDLGIFRRHLMGYGDLTAKQIKNFVAFYPSLFEALSISKRQFRYILINEPYFVIWMNLNTTLNFDLQVVLAANSQDWLNRIKERDGDDHAFYQVLRKNHEIWYKHWKTDAEKLEVKPIILKESQFLSDIFPKEERHENL